MSNLQVLARRCPIMGKAMAVQSARAGNSALAGAFGGVRAYGGKAKLHTTRAREATVVAGVLHRPDDGMLVLCERYQFPCNEGYITLNLV